MTHLQELFEEPQVVMKMQLSLESIANMDTSAETRQLADKYLTILNSTR